jgi:hypothetical protein
VSTLQDELGYITRAQAALQARDASQALVLLDEHASRYPRGQLADEREGLRIIARCALGQPGAPAKADRFLRSRPDSPLATRIRAECSKSPR